jgi:putative transcriptional regulator
MQYINIYLTNINLNPILLVEDGTADAFRSGRLEATPRRERLGKERSGMAIEVKLDLVMVKKKISLTELSARVGISLTNLSLLKTGKVKGVRFSTLEALCRELDCQPADLLEYVPAAAAPSAPPEISVMKETSNE